jgi:putative ABC transport system substrate-binding protein
VNGLSRREFILGAGAVGVSAATGFGLLAGCGRLPWQGEAQAKTYRIGYLSDAESDTGSATVEAFRQGLHEYGLVEDQNIIIEYRWAGGIFERLPELAAGLVQNQVDVIVAAPSSAPAHAAKDATDTIPVVMLGAVDPVREGLILSLARPGGNVTGLSTDAGPGLYGKLLEYLTAVLPGQPRVTVLWNPVETGRSANLEDALVAARALGIEVLSVPVGGPDEFDSAFEIIDRERATAVLLIGGLIFQHRGRIAEFALRHRLPSIYGNRVYAEAGGLMSFGPKSSEMARRGGYYVDRILKGTNPADLPVEQPMTFDFVVNMKTARELGITFPNEIMLQVTEVIE